MAKFGSNVKEQSSFAEPQLAAVTHHDIRYTVDFEGKKLVGSVTYTVRKNDAAATEVVLDTNHLTLTDLPQGASLDAELEPFGRALRIPLPGDLAVDGVTSFTVGFETTAASAALQFLAPSQTAGKGHPYLFTQCQAIHCRSMMPCQDAPGIKATYNAAVTVPSPLVAVMSAVPTGEPVADAAAGTVTYSFAQRIPISSYLIALAVGNLASRAIGPRSRVYAEPEVVEAAAYEFGETEAMIVAAEKLLGPYVWGEYNILCLPPSFPYGGMENPCLTFVTPTLLAGDRSLADVIAHELAHSWSGNLVTNQTANAFFLNEGFTMLIERKILTALHGGDEGVFHFSAESGSLALASSVEGFLARGQPEFTKLVPDLSGVDPDDAFSSVPYEKGFSLLYHLQTLVGVAPFDAFLHDYFQTFKYTSLTADDFKAYVIAYFKEGRWLLPRVGHTGIPPGHGGPLTSAADVAEIPALARLNAGGQPVPPVGGDLPADVIASAAASGIDLTSSVDWDAWFYGAGGPPVPITFAASERGAVAAHVAQWLADPDAAEAGGRTLTSAWPSSHWIAFVEGLNAASSGLMAGASKAIIHPAVLRRMDAAYGLGSMRNAEVRCGWLQTGVRSGLEGAVPAALAFLGEQGRMKYVRPLVRELARSSLGREAVRTFLAAHATANYHPICAKMALSDLDKECAQPAVDPATLATVPKPAAEKVLEGTTAADSASSGNSSSGSESAAPVAEAAAAAEAPFRAQPDSEPAPETTTSAASAEAEPAQPETAAGGTASASSDASPSSSEETGTSSSAAAGAPAPAAPSSANTGEVLAVEDVDEEEDGEDEGDEEEEGDEEGEEEEEEEDATAAGGPARRLRFGQRRKAAGSPRKKKVTFAAGTAQGPPPSPASAPWPPSAASAAGADGSSSSSSSGAASPAAIKGEEGKQEEKKAAAVVAARSPSSAAAPAPDTPAVASARAALEQIAQLRATKGMTPLAAARAAKGLSAPQSGSDDDEGGPAGGSGGPLAWAQAATSTLLETPLVSAQTADNVSKWAALAGVGAALGYAVWVAYRAGRR